MTIEPNNLHAFDSVAEFGEGCQKIAPSFRKFARLSGATFNQSLARCRDGDTSLVPLAERMMGDALAGVDLSTVAPRWGLDVAGAYPSVPDFLSGQPECMWRMQNTENERGPIRIFNCASASGGCDNSTLIQRGVATLALAMALSAIRPTELYMLDINGTMNVMVRLQTSPMVLSEVCYALTEPNFVYGLMYGYVHSCGHYVAWPAGIGRDEGRNRAICARLLNALETDLIIPPSIHGNSLLESDPKAWLAEKLRHYSAVGGDTQ